MWRRRLVASLVVAAALLVLASPVWRENERRYADLRLTGCFGDTGVPGVTQECTGNVRRLCRDAPPLIDWRRFCQ
jgi:hypothetical protein